MKLQKWNYSIEDYEDYKIPDNWHCVTYCEDLDEIINCVQCGREVEFGDTYTSKEVHTSIGFGYSVCEDCYKKEVERYENHQVEKARKILGKVKLVDCIKMSPK